MGDFPMMTERGHLHHQRHRAGGRVPARALARGLLQPGAGQDHRQGRLHRQDHPQPRGVARVRRRQEGHRRRPDRPQAPAERHGAAQGARLVRRTRSSRCSTSAESIKNTLEKDHVETPEEALEDIYRKLRPGEPPTAESARTLLENLFFNPKRYDLARVGRYKVNKKLEAAQGVLQSQLKARSKQLGELDNPDKKGWDQPKFRVWAELQKDEQGENGPKYKGILSYEDMLRTVRYLVKLHAGEEGYEPDDIDHFGNRRLRSVGELIQNQIRIGLSRMERVVRERMTTQDVEAITPQTLINIRPVVASIKEFFGTIAAVAVHGPDQPARRTDPQAPAVGARARWALARARGVRGPGRPPLALRPDVPDRDAGGPEHRPDRVALDLRAHQPVRVHRDPVPPGHGRQGHRQGRLPLRRRGGPARHRAGQRADQARRRATPTRPSWSAARAARSTRWCPTRSTTWTSRPSRSSRSGRP